MRLVSRILGQSLGLLALSAIVAFGVNAARPDGLPLAQAAPKAAPSAVQLSQASGEIALKDAAMLFLSGRAVFLDARSDYEYQLGHIQGAISLPVRNFASEFQDIKPRLAGKEAVIAYCDGPECPLSHALVKHLREAGTKNVYVLRNGWALWQAERLPVAKGSGQQSQQGQSSQQRQSGAPAPTAVQKAPAAKAPAPQPGKTPKMSTVNAAKPVKPDMTDGQDKLCTDCSN
ncbi:MAG: rhodanese-like domain-containing protein [Humidesulfovibrio sp.]|nr:rhodanese-like domain-containing protein [Humidesulfovibrio sp.]